MENTKFEIRYESQERNEKFFYKLQGRIRYELSDFVSMVNGNGKSKIRFKLTEKNQLL